MKLLSLETIRLGLNNLRLHKLRSLLTSLGIIFGVAAVICMLSITEGASADELRMIQLLGTRNIIVNSIKPPQTQQTAEGNTNLTEYGVTRDDIDTAILGYRGGFSPGTPLFEKLMKMYSRGIASWSEECTAAMKNAASAAGGANVPPGILPIRQLGNPRPAMSRNDTP